MTDRQTCSYKFSHNWQNKKLNIIGLAYNRANKHDHSETLKNTVYISYMQELLQFITEMLNRIEFF